MAITPIARELGVVEQGGEVFITPSAWIDIVQAGASPVSYNVTALRTALKAASSVANQAGWANLPLFFIFSADGPFWANFNGRTAAIPSGAVTDGTASEFNPNQRYITSDITAISFVAASNVNISIQVYKP